MIRDNSSDNSLERTGIPSDRNSEENQTTPRVVGIPLKHASKRSFEAPPPNPLMTQKVKFRFEAFGSTIYEPQ